MYKWSGWLVLVDGEATVESVPIDWLIDSMLIMRVLIPFYTHLNSFKLLWVSALCDRHDNILYSHDAAIDMVLCVCEIWISYACNRAKTPFAFVSLETYIVFFWLSSMALDSVMTAISLWRWCCDYVSFSLVYVLNLYSLVFQATDDWHHRQSRMCFLRVFQVAVSVTVTVLFSENAVMDNVAIIFQLMAVWLTVRYRNSKDPKINPATFL